MGLALCLFFSGIARRTALVVSGHEACLLPQLVRGQPVYRGAPWQPAPMQYCPVQPQPGSNSQPVVNCLNAKSDKQQHMLGTTAQERGHFVCVNIVSRQKV